MILIADAGSTKCDWVVLQKNGEEFLRTKTEGINPAVFKIDVLEGRIKQNTYLQACRTKVNKVFFYGAGCGTETPKKALKTLLESYFLNAKVVVKEDIEAAVFSVTTKPGIVSILGTGSNSCYFDGDKIHTNLPSLGYAIMDEASGNYFGKKLIKDYFYGKMPKQIANVFEKEFDLDADKIKLNLYQKENPNAYLASFAAFIFTNEMNPYFKKTLQKGIEKFFKNRIKPYQTKQNIPIHFIGSVAYFCADIIVEVAEKYNYTVGAILQKPIDGLIKYHQNKI